MSIKLQRRASIGGIRNRGADTPEMTLDDYYHMVSKTILCNQNAITGLFVAGKDTDHAWVRDNVYAIMAVWGLSLSYKKHLDQMENWTKCYELEQVTINKIKLMHRQNISFIFYLECCQNHARFINVHDETSEKSRKV